MAPAQKPHRSKQDYETPQEFIEALEKRFGGLAWDLACTRTNGKGRRGPDGVGYLCADTFTLDWAELDGTVFCNPPFGDIARWVKKMAAECTHRPGFTLLVVPASIGTAWFEEHVQKHAYTEGLIPRLSFDGENPYPKDLALISFGFGFVGFGTWRWK